MNFLSIKFAVCGTTIYSLVKTKSKATARHESDSI